MNNISRSLNNLSPLLLTIAGVGLHLQYAITDQWSLPEFCWSTWLAAFYLSLAFAMTGMLGMILDACAQRKHFETRIKITCGWPYPVFLILFSILILTVGWLLWHLLGYLFGFYGIFLSWIAQMEPLLFFGVNGFINSDFFTPVTYLTIKFWPAVAGAFLANLGTLLSLEPRKALVYPFSSGEILRIHLMVVLMPFFCLGAWLIDRNQYQPITIIILTALFYLSGQKRTQTSNLAQSKNDRNKT